MIDCTVKMRSVSSLEKCFTTEKIETKPEFTRATAIKGERFSFEVLYSSDDSPAGWKYVAHYKLSSPDNSCVKVSRIDSVPVRMPMYKSDEDDNFISKEPGLYPDLMIPITEENQLYIFRGELMSLWVDVEIPEDANAGAFPIDIALVNDEGEEYSSVHFDLEIIDAVLPKQNIKVTQWFHADCLASYYRVETFGEDHWRIIEEFLKTAVKNGINMILTPVLTPALDTKVGGERPTVQLVDVFLDKGKWSFGFEKLRRWVDLCLSVGVEYFEIAHLFTQWGAEHAPKVMATVDGEYKRIFGWETDAVGDEYKAFLSAFLPALKEELERLGIFDRTVFHLSDEPGGDKLDNYIAVKKTVEDLLDGCVIMDALSDFSFYQKGALNTPVVSIDHIEPYLEAGVKNLWTYYCCCQWIKVSNRFVSMPQARNRIIGTQFYKYDVAGFLQWGYNFYYSQFSVEPIDPYHCTDGGYFVPAGDAFSVYPAPDGTAYETLHLVGFTQALYDLRAMKLLESLTDKETVMAILEDGIEPITFKEYPRSDEYLLSVREKINSKIKEALGA